MTLADGTVVKFAVEAFARTCLLQGVDALGFLRGKGAEISAFEQAHQ